MNSLIPDLPGPAWRLLGADALSAVGTGLTLPFLLVYLHSSRGLEVGIVAAVVASIGLVGFLGNPLGGWLADRWGARPTLLAGLLVTALGTVAWLGVSRPWEAFAASALYALGTSVCWPSQSSLLSGVVDPHQRSNAFSVGHMTLNTGLGAGGLLAATIVDVGRPDSFVLLYLVDAATFMGAAGIITFSVPAARRTVNEAGKYGAGELRKGYRTIVLDRAFVRLWGVTAVLFTAGFGQMAVTFPLVATEYVGLPAARLGILYAVNTITVVILQLIVLRSVAGRQRTRVLMLLAISWSASWLLVLFAGHFGTGVLALTILIASTVVFAFGETLMSTSLAPMANDLAPQELRGRYNGAFALAYTTGFAAGPLLAGLLLEFGSIGTLLVTLALLAAGSILGLRGLERLLPARVNQIPSARIMESDFGSEFPRGA